MFVVISFSSFRGSRFQNLDHSELLQFSPTRVAKGAQRIDRRGGHFLEARATLHAAQRFTEPGL
jgi:hypothetical protein